MAGLRPETQLAPSDLVQLALNGTAKVLLASEPLLSLSFPCPVSHLHFLHQSADVRSAQQPAPPTQQ